MRIKLIFLSFFLLVISLLSACSVQPSGAGTNPGAGVPANAALKISGKVNQEVGWTEEELRSMETVEVESVNSKGEADTYTGVPLARLLQAAGVQAEASTLVFTGEDDLQAEVAWSEAQACQDCLVSFRNRGGFSLVMPGFPDKAQVKGVTSIEVK